MKGFDNDKYLSLQTERIHERMAMLGGKLYLEFGGKLFDDYHAARVLPGFQPDSKMQMLLKMKDDAEIIIAINAGDIEKSKVRGDLGISYSLDVLRLIDAFRQYGLYVGSVVLTRYKGQPAAEKFERRLKELGISTYRHYPIEGYPTNVSHIVSPEGFGKNEFIRTTRPIVVVTAPGPGSGKMATCLSQLYHEAEHGNKVGYAKFETFPIWNLPLKHPVNLAYEAATVDLDDVNMIDPYHLEAYGKTAVNYNRDVEIFPVLEEIFTRTLGSCPYKSPTDMGVNTVGNCICDDEVCCEAARQEVIRRYLDTCCEVVRGRAESVQVNRLEIIMNMLQIDPSRRKTVPAARQKAELTGEPAVAIELPDGALVTGKTSELLGASAAALINAVKHLAGIGKDIRLISPAVLSPIQELKVGHLGNRNPRLHTDEVLIALAVSAVTNPMAGLALSKLDGLAGSQVHSSVILSSVDETTFHSLGAELTCEPVYQTRCLYHR